MKLFQKISNMLKLNHFSKRVRGFTLLELVIVIAIIGILAVIVLPNMIQALAKARDAKKMTELRGIQTFLTVTGIDTTLRYPADQSTLVTVYGNTKNRAPVALPATGATDSQYHYVGINCNNTDYPDVKMPGNVATGQITCAGYQLWTELEAKNPALDLDADVTDTVCQNYGAAAGTCSATNPPVLLHTTALELCTSSSGRDCVFDLAP